MFLLSERLAHADGSGGIIVIAVIYAILTAVGQIKKAADRARQPPRPAARPAPKQVATPRPRSPAPSARRSSAPQMQSEARRLEELLRGLAQSRAEASENTESLEVDRDPVDQDSEAEAVALRRIQAAEARNRPLTDADHAEFDQRLKREESKQPVARKAIGRDRLRNAIIWKEILAPPLALRDIHRPEA